MKVCYSFISRSIYLLIQGRLLHFFLFLHQCKNAFWWQLRGFLWVTGHARCIMCLSILTLVSPSSQEAALRDYGLGEFSASASIPEERRETDSPNVSTTLLFLQVQLMLRWWCDWNTESLMSTLFNICKVLALDPQIYVSGQCLWSAFSCICLLIVVLCRLVGPQTMRMKKEKWFLQQTRKAHHYNRSKILLLKEKQVHMLPFLHVLFLLYEG